MRQSQVMQSAIYSCDTVVAHVLTPAVLSLGSQQNMSGQNVIRLNLAVYMLHVCIFFRL